MNLLLDVLLPALVFLVMGIVGTGLTTDDLRRVVQYPRAVVAGTLGQVILLPAVAVLLVRVVEPPEVIAAGLLLLVTCPGGAISNTYTYLARANLALSITLTAFSSALSVLTLPMVMSLAFRYGLGSTVNSGIPVWTIVAQLVLLLLVPASIGMIVRRKAPGFVARSRRGFQVLSWVAILALVAYVFFEEHSNLSAVFGATIAYALGFTVAAMALGLLVSRLSGCSSPSDHFVLTFEFAVRNLPIATLVGASALGRTDFVVFSGAVFIAQTPLLVALLLWFRRWRGELNEDGGRRTSGSTTNS